MCLTITVTNLKTKADSVFRFRNETQATDFRDQIERDVYKSSNKHIRDETPPCQGTLTQYVIYTSLEDLERVTVKYCN